MHNWRTGRSMLSGTHLYESGQMCIVMSLLLQARGGPFPHPYEHPRLWLTLRHHVPGNPWQPLSGLFGLWKKLGSCSPWVWLLFLRGWIWAPSLWLSLSVEEPLYCGVVSPQNEWRSRRWENSRCKFGALTTSKHLKAETCCGHLLYIFIAYSLKWAVSRFDIDFLSEIFTKIKETNISVISHNYSPLFSKST